MELGLIPILPAVEEFGVVLVQLYLNHRRRTVNPRNLELDDKGSPGVFVLFDSCQLFVVYIELLPACTDPATAPAS